MRSSPPNENSSTPLVQHRIGRQIGDKAFQFGRGAAACAHHDALRDIHPHRPARRTGDPATAAHGHPAQRHHVAGHPPRAGLRIDHGAALTAPGQRHAAEGKISGDLDRQRAFGGLIGRCVAIGWCTQDAGILRRRAIGQRQQT